MIQCVFVVEKGAEDLCQSERVDPLDHHFLQPSSDTPCPTSPSPPSNPPYSIHRHSQSPPHPKAPTKHSCILETLTLPTTLKINTLARTAHFFPPKSDSNQKHFKLKHLFPAHTVFEVWSHNVKEIQWEGSSSKVSGCGEYNDPTAKNKSQQ